MYWNLPGIILGMKVPGNPLAQGRSRKEDLLEPSPHFFLSTLKGLLYFILVSRKLANLTGLAEMRLDAACQAGHAALDSGPFLPYSSASVPPSEAIRLP